MSSPSPAKSRWRSVVKRSTSLLSVTRSDKDKEKDKDKEREPRDSISSSRPPTPGASERDSDEILGSISRRNSTAARSSESLTSIGGGGGGAPKAGRLDTSSSTLSPPKAAALMMPSPIAESPLREAEATIIPVPVGPSPLALATSGQSAATEEAGNEPTTTNTNNETEDKPATRGGAVASEDSGSPPQPVSGLEENTGYVPPPLLDSKAGNPGAFTDDPDSLPQPTTLRDPWAPSSQTPSNAPSIKQPLDAQGTAGGLASPPRSERAARSLKAENSTSSDGYGATLGNGGFFGKPLVESIYEGGAQEDTGLFGSAVDVNAEMAGSGYQKAKEAKEEAEKAKTVEREYTLPAYEAQEGGGNVWGSSSSVLKCVVPLSSRILD